MFEVCSNLYKTIHSTNFALTHDKAKTLHPNFHLIGSFFNNLFVDSVFMLKP